MEYIISVINCACYSCVLHANSMHVVHELGSQTFTVSQEWNAELAAVAQSHSDKCSLTENTARETSSYVSSEIGENINVTANLVNPHTYIHNVITYWESLGDLYEYETNVLSDIEARLYTQVSQDYYFSV